MIGIWLLLAAVAADPNAANEIPDHYCGIYSTHAAMKAVGISVRLEDLCKPEYVGTYQGSSLEELKRAVTENGGHVRAMSGLTLTALRNSDSPMILHVRRLGLKTEFDHWIAYLGSDELGKARVVDPPFAVATMEHSELNALWDGIGLVVSKGPVDPSAYWLASLAEGMIALVVVVAVLAGFRWLIGARRAWLALATSTLALSAMLAIGADSFLRHPNAVGIVLGHHDEPPVGEVDYSQVAQSVRHSSRVVIDCRYPDAFAHGNIPTSVNLPIHSGPAQQFAFLKNYSRETPFVIYCQSTSCLWSDSLAAALYHYGYQDVVVYRGGWNDWASHDAR